MQKTKKILLIGAGGHSKVILDTIIENNEYDEIGIIDTIKHNGTIISGVSVIGKDEDLKRFFDLGYKYAFIAVGSIGNSQIRRRILYLLKKIGFMFPIIVDKSAIISPYSNIMEGTYIGRNVVINSHTKVGKHAIINTGSIIEHDNIIGDFVHISPGSVLCGNVMIGNDTHIGANSTVINNTKIGSKSIIGIGSVVLKDVKSKVTAYGNPCKEVLK